MALPLPPSCRAFAAHRALVALAFGTALLGFGCDSEPDDATPQVDAAAHLPAQGADVQAADDAGTRALDASPTGTPSVSADGGAAARSDAARDSDAAGARDAARDESPGRDAAVDSGSDALAPPPAACGGELFCADFEDQPAGALSGAWKTSTPNCSGDGKASIDETVAHAGKRALRIQSGGGTCNHMFATPNLDVARFQSSLWVRFYVRFDSALREDHVTFVALHDDVSQKDLRMGGQKQILMWNRERDDATLPELSPKGVSLSVSPKPQSWLCVEFHLRGDDGALETFVDGTQVPGLIVDGTPTQDVDGQWLRPGAFRASPRDLRLGWESYGSQPMILWFDDVAIGAARPGC